MARPLFPTYSFRLFQSFGSQMHHLSLWTPQMALSTLQKHYVSKVELSNLMPEMLYHWEKKRQNDKWFYFLSSKRPNLSKKCYKAGEKTPKGQTVPFSRMYKGGEEGMVGGVRRLRPKLWQRTKCACSLLTECDRLMLQPSVRHKLCNKWAANQEPRLSRASSERYPRILGLAVLIWHSERHSQERSAILQHPPSKTPFS